MTRSTEKDVLQKCMALPWEACLALYADLFSSSPDATPTVARVLRDKARAGELPEDVIPMLAIFVVDAPNAETLSQLAKALAAFGRKAAIGEQFLVDRIRTLAVTSDETLWALDGCLHALGYIGGDAARALVEELQEKTPSPVMRSRSVYKGTIPEQDREALFHDTLSDVRRRLDEKDPGRWGAKVTQRAAVVAAPAKKTAPWMTR